MNRLSPPSSQSCCHLFVYIYRYMHIVYIMYLCWYLLSIIYIYFICILYMYNDVCVCICIGVDYKSRQFSLVEQCGPPGDRISSATLKEPELTEVPHHYQNLCSQWLNGILIHPMFFYLWGLSHMF